MDEWSDDGERSIVIRSIYNLRILERAYNTYLLSVEPISTAAVYRDTYVAPAAPSSSVSSEISASKTKMAPY